MARKINFKEISAHEIPEKSPGFLLWHISSAWRSSIESVLRPFGLTHPQFVVLATIGWLTRNEDLVTQAAVGKMAGLDPNTNSQIMKGLEKKGLLKREKLSDARAKNPLLSPKGSELLVKALPAVEAKDGQFFDNLSNQEVGSMIKLFQKLTPSK